MTPPSESERLERQVTSEALHRFQGEEFDMMAYLVEKAFIRSELKEAADQ